MEGSGRLDAVIRFCCLFLNHALSSGVSYSFGIFYLPLIQEFGTTSAVTAWVASLSTGTTCVIAPVVSWILERRGVMTAMLVGAVLASAGLIATSLAPNIYVIYATYAIATGAGHGFLYHSSIMAVFYFFRGNQPLVQGTSLAGISVGALVVPVACRYAMDQYGWRGTMLLLGGVTLHTVAFALLFKTPLYNISKDGNKPEEKKKIQDEEPKSRLQVLCSLNVVLLCSHGFCFTFGYNIFYIYVAPLTEVLGHSSHVSALVLSSVGFANLVGRLLMGIIVNIGGVDAVVFYAVSSAVAGLASVLLPASSALVYLFCLCIIASAMCAGLGILMVETLSSVFSIRNISTVYSCLQVFHSVGFMSGGPCAGWLLDVTGAYQKVYALSGASLLLSSVFMLGLRFTKSRKSVAPGPDAYVTVLVNGKCEQLESTGQVNEELNTGKDLALAEETEKEPCIIKEGVV